MINQKLYPDIKLGNGSVTIATDGCYEMSLLRGLQIRGYNFGVREFNQWLIDHGVFPKNSALLSAAVIAEKCPEIFLEGRNEAWNDIKIKQYLSDSSYIVLGEVSGEGIGGSGQHFVLIDRVEVKPDGKISMTIIDDPWDGLEDQKVTTRYNAYGNILSLRVFKIKKGGSMSNMFKMQSGKEVDLSNTESMKVVAQVYDDAINRGIYTKKTDADKALNDLNTKLTQEKDQAVSDAKKTSFDEGYTKGKSENTSHSNPPQDQEWKANGRQRIYDGEGKLVQTIYNEERYSK